MTEVPTNPPASSEPASVPAPAPVPKPAPARASWRPPYVFFTLVTAVTLAADLGTKAWAEKRLASPSGWSSPIEVAHTLSFVLARNRGGAWGILQDAAESVRRPFFFGVSALAIAFIVSLYRKLAPHQRALRWGLPLVLGGALGNLVDRIRYGSVVDFIDFHVRIGGHDRHWPTFNVADIAICVGIGLMAIDMLTTRKPAPRASDVPSHP